MYKNHSLKKYLDDLAAKLPAPGGGSAAALTGALGCALLSMVCNFTFGKEKYKIFEKEIKDIFKKTETLRKDLLKLIDLDVIAYKDKDINKTLDAPLKVAKNCLEAIELCTTLIKKANPNLISDVLCAAVLLEAGFSSAYANILINLRYLKNSQIKSRISRSFAKNFKKIQNIRKKVEKDVCDIIRR